MCRSEFCKKDGGAASIRMPTDAAKWERWAESLWGHDHGRVRHGDQRVSLAHFHPDSLQADVASQSLDGSSVQVKVVDGALPDQSDEAMFRAAKGSLARSLKSGALVRRHGACLLHVNGQLADAKTRISELKAENSVLRAQLKEAKAEKKEAAAATAEIRCIDHTIMRGKTETQCRSLAGVNSHDSLVVSQKHERLLDLVGVSSLRFAPRDSCLE